MNGLLGSDTNFAAVQALRPTGEPKASRIWALTPKTRFLHRLFSYIGDRRKATYFDTGFADLLNPAQRPKARQDPSEKYIEAMKNRNRNHNRTDLVRIATHVMAERGLQPHFTAAALKRLASIRGAAVAADDVDGEDESIADLTDMLWCSIDNDDSQDLDQLTVCELLEKGKDRGAIRMLVAIADVDAIVKKGSAIDAYAGINTTSVYTSARIFPMLPERLSCDLTSLNAGEDRLALVTEMVFAADATLSSATLYRAKVRNKAKLAYDAVSAWIEGQGRLPEEAAKVPGLDAQLHAQDAGYWGQTPISLRCKASYPEGVPKAQ